MIAILITIHANMLKQFLIQYNRRVSGLWFQFHETGWYLLRDVAVVATSFTVWTKIIANTGHNRQILDQTIRIESGMTCLSMTQYHEILSGGRTPFRQANYPCDQLRAGRLLGLTGTHEERLKINSKTRNCWWAFEPAERSEPSTQCFLSLRSRILALR